jgi:HEAT repeat protein
MEDPDPDVRLAAATAAGALEVDRALRPLLAMLEAEANPDRLQSLIRALGALGDPGAVPAIEKHAVRTLFSKPPTEVRVEAYRALHRIGSPHARDLVQQALSDKDVGLRAAVRRIVGSAGPK